VRVQYEQQYEQGKKESDMLQKQILEIKNEKEELEVLLLF
jgi:hypothetical protein